MLRRTEFWLNKVGIVLFLCGVAFLFKYAIDKQWITEEERLATGVLLGSVLLVLGLRLHATRRHFSQVLVGGAIAAYYITGYAAYNIFPDLHVPYQIVFGFMGFATLLAFVISLWGDELALSLIGVTGGFLTPFVLNGNEVHLPFLMTYICLLLAGTSAIYIYRGWRSLLWTSFAGGWAILAFGWFYECPSLQYNVHFLAENDLAYLQVGAIAMLVAFWAAPVLHEVLGHRDPIQYRTPPLDFLTHTSLKKLHLYIFTACTPFLALAYTAALWIPDSLSVKTLGWVAVGGAAVFALVGWLVRRTNGRLAYLHAMVAIGLLNTGLVLILEGNALLFALAAQAAILHLIAFRYKDVGMERTGILIFGVVGIWMVQRLVPGIDTQSPALINPQALTDLAVMGLAFGSSFFVRQVEVRVAYRSFAHIAVLAWLWREIHGFPNGDGYVMLAWAAYGILMHLAARRLDGEELGIKGIRLRPATFAAHLAFEAAFGLLAYRLATGYSGSTPIFNQKAAIDLIVMGMALATSFMVAGKNTATIYRLAVNGAVLAWLWREATPADLTNGYVMFRWAAYSAVVAFVSHRLRDRVMLLASAAPFPVIAALFAWRITGVHGGSLALLNTNTLVDLSTLALALAVSFVAQPRETAIALRLGFHAGVLALLWRELNGLEYGYYYLMLAWAAYAALLYGVAFYRSDLLTRWIAHCLATIVGVWMLGRIATGLIFHNPNATPVFNQQGLTELAIIALAAIFYWMVKRERYAGLAFGLWLHMAVLGWIWQELGLLPDGNGPVSIAWGVYALILIGASLQLGRNRTLMVCGISTLFLVAAKLFLVDLVMYQIDVVWRILLFIGFGGLFLLISYLFQNVARRDEGAANDEQ